MQRIDKPGEERLTIHKQASLEITPEEDRNFQDIISRVDALRELLILAPVPREQEEQEKSLAAVREALVNARQGDLRQVGLLYEAMRNKRSPHYIPPGVDLDSERPLTPEELCGYLEQYGEQEAQPNASDSKQYLTVQEFLTGCAAEFREGNFAKLAYFCSREVEIARGSRRTLLYLEHPMYDSHLIDLETLKGCLPSETEIQQRKTSLKQKNAIRASEGDDRWVDESGALTNRRREVLQAIANEVNGGNLRELVPYKVPEGVANLSNLEKMGSVRLTTEALFWEAKLCAHAFRHGNIDGLNIDLFKKFKWIRERMRHEVEAGRPNDGHDVGVNQQEVGISEPMWVGLSRKYDAHGRFLSRLGAERDSSNAPSEPG